MKNELSIENLKSKYKNVPIELQNMKRWVCYKVEGMENGKTTKRPYNAMNGSLAKVNDKLTWTKFSIALQGCVKWGCDGIGFILGEGIFGIDLDNHPDENGETPMTDEEFKEFSKEFIEKLDSYTELSQSGKGIHIICQGKLPQGRRRKGSVEMYDSGRFFAFTGNAIKNIPIQNREEEIKELWEKHINVVNTFQPRTTFIVPSDREVLTLSDDEIIEKALASRNGEDFYRYYHNGDISKNHNDASAADMAFCNMLAFWCNGDIAQMDRIFRHSALMREKWDEYRGEKTYGQITLEQASNNVTNGYVKTVPKPLFENNSEDSPYFNVRNKFTSSSSNNTSKDKKEDIKEDLKENTQTKERIINFEPEMNVDEKGEPIFRIKKIFKQHPYNDTGNALRFYDYFGHLFKYNVTDKIFMFWTGKTWVKDYTEIIRKYANKLIDILKAEEKELYEKIERLLKEGKKDEADLTREIYKACEKNATRVANKAGKDAMLSEFKALYDIPVESSIFNSDDYLLNTDSGIVNLKTGKIEPFDKTKMISKNTNVKVSYEEPVVWLNFLKSTFNTGSQTATQEIIDSLQTCLGYSLSGSTREQVLFLLHGSGSNGKTTLTEQIAHILGDYAENIASNVLMQQNNPNSSATFSIAKLQTARFVETGETEKGGSIAESQVKILTGGDSISAQFKFGNEFSFKPKFKIWMSTNNLPNIRGRDNGIWRRIFLFPFENTFSDKDKDKDLPDKLKAESDRILGWCIQGFLKYQEIGDLIKPQALDDAKNRYKTKMDIVSQFLQKECEIGDKYCTNCKDFYKYYKDWSLDNTEFTIKESQFTEELAEKGIVVSRDSNGKRIYKGVKIAGTATIQNKVGGVYDGR